MQQNLIYSNLINIVLYGVTGISNNYILVFFLTLFSILL